MDFGPNLLVWPLGRNSLGYVMMQTKLFAMLRSTYADMTPRPGLRNALAAIVLGLPMCVMPRAVAAPVVPEAARNVNSTLDGDLLAGIVFTQRHDVHYAGGALYAAVHDGMTDPVFISTALHFVAMDAGDNAAERAVDLASKLQDDNLARLVLGNQAIYRDDWSKALGIFQTDRTPPSFLTFLAPVLQAWCLFAQGKGAPRLPSCIRRRIRISWAVWRPCRKRGLPPY
ncbi:hypothetical protein A0U93_01435 [Neoasaia chiangmaiensis]|uniref:Uncharacterized protein n=2 Tax=Neoasaia chiangmaiensis TaxID=320497 RepID=A0A1U9KM09_9PROT|nr:hypothetical protein A0U93_01435 [Neoasaia chiangmaiensis]